MARHAVLLVEDSTVTRNRLARVIEAHPQLALQAAVGTCAAARAELARSRPDVLLTDLDLPDGNGVELVREVQAARGAVAAMVITIFGDERHVVAALEAGALGYLLKDGDADYVASSILEMLAGGSPISPPIARYLLRRFQGDAGNAPAAAGAPALSEREREVLNLVVKGLSNAEIAKMLAVAPTTVASHVRSIYQKLDVHSRGEVVYEAMQLGLVK
jgi:DNA-binding NarL/FixJ family response regulator